MARPIEAEGSSSQATDIEPLSTFGAAAEVMSSETEETSLVSDDACGGPAAGLDDDPRTSPLCAQMGQLTELLGPGEVGLAGSMGQVDGQATEPNSAGQSSQETVQVKEQDNLLSMESPLLVRFEMTSEAPDLLRMDIKDFSLPNSYTEDCLDTFMAVDSPVEDCYKEIIQEQVVVQSPIGKDLTEEAEVTTEISNQMGASPVIWRPAEEVLATDGMADPSDYALPRACVPSKVYVRRPRPRAQVTKQEVVSTPRTPPPTSEAAVFLKKVSKPLDNTLPVPFVKQRRRQTQAVTEPPRRSRRVAKLPPEIHNPVAASVCRQLGFTEENSKVTPAMVEKYEVFFKSPLERNHVKVMATMLHKELPDNIPGRVSGAIVVA